MDINALSLCKKGRKYSTIHIFNTEWWYQVLLKKKEEKVSLNIKISKDMDLRLKRARMAAREQGLIFNVSKEVELFLEKKLKKVEQTLSLNDEIKENLNELNLLSKHWQI